MGGLGSDTMTGGAGGDVFDFNDAAEGNWDVITDFVSGVDRIDLSTIDASPANSQGNHAFVFLGSGAFTHATGQVRYSVTSDGVVFSWRCERRWRRRLQRHHGRRLLAHRGGLRPLAAARPDPATFRESRDAGSVSLVFALVGPERFAPKDRGGDLGLARRVARAWRGVVGEASSALVEGANERVWRPWGASLDRTVVTRHLNRRSSPRTGAALLLRLARLGRAGPTCAWRSASPCGGGANVRRLGPGQRR
ncbi:M10 family metallopeptidase C-terminal domain-containing protein [Caulobacter segnis]